MARALFYNIPTHGHVNPTLPLVRELTEQGDEVTYFAGPEFADKIRSAGATYGDYGESHSFEQTRTEAHSVLQAGQLAEATAALLPGVLEEVEAARPDYLLFDMSAPWASIAAQRLGIPAVASFPHLPFNWRAFFDDGRIMKKGLHGLRPGMGYYRELSKQLGRLAKEHGLRRPSEVNLLSSSADLNLVFSSRYFQPNADSLDDSYQFIGPVINTDRPDQQWPITREPGQKLIYVAVGTLYRADLDFFRHAMDAFSDDEYSVVMSVGKAVDPAALGPVPANFDVAQFVPQLAILDQADVFVTHGGMNSISEAVMAGVPMVAVPNTIEQAMNSVRVEQLRGGVALPPELVTAATLRQAAESVLADAGVPDGLAKIRQSFVEAGGAPRGADAIQDFKRSRSID